MDNKGLTDYRVQKDCGLANGLIRQARLGKSDLGRASVEKILDKYSDLSRIWLLTGEGEMINTASIQTTLSDPIQPYHTTPRPIPYYTVDFEGGFDLMINDQTATPERLVTFPNQPQRATCCCHITGHSMEPELNNGDIIVLEHIPDFSWLPLGEIYAIVTTNGMRTVKRLMRADDDTCYRLHPANTNYPDQDIPKNILQHVFRVVGSYKNL